MHIIFKALDSLGWEHYTFNNRLTQKPGILFHTCIQVINMSLVICCEL